MNEAVANLDKDKQIQSLVRQIQDLTGMYAQVIARLETLVEQQSDTIRAMGEQMQVKSDSNSFT